MSTDTTSVNDGTVTPTAAPAPDPPLRQLVTALYEELTTAHDHLMTHGHAAVEYAIEHLLTNKYTAETLRETLWQEVHNRGDRTPTLARVDLQGLAELMRQYNPTLTIGLDVMPHIISRYNQHRQRASEIYIDSRSMPRNRAWGGYVYLRVGVLTDA